MAKIDLVVDAAKQAILVYFMLGIFVWVVVSLIGLYLAVDYGVVRFYPDGKSQACKQQIRFYQKQVNTLTEAVRMCKNTLEGLNTIVEDLEDDTKD